MHQYNSIIKEIKIILNKKIFQKKIFIILKKGQKKQKNILKAKKTKRLKIKIILIIMIIIEK